MEFVAEDYAWKASASSALTRSKLPFAFLSGCTMFENLDYSGTGLSRMVGYC